MKNCILVILMALVLPSVLGSSDVYKIDLEIYSNDTVTLNSIGRIKGLMSHFSGSQTSYQVKVLSVDEELFSGNFYVSFTILTDPPREDEPLESRHVELRVPYYENAKEVKIFHLGNEIFSTDLSGGIINQCNYNGTCDTTESEATCPADCASQKPGFNLMLVIVPVALIIVVLIGFFVAKKLKGQKQNMVSGYEQGSGI